ncbi:MAG: small basic protein [Candidatus Omnitrophica bacterium]|nr:small basic protein [Candidatus Omnitrophota bacterium]
MSQHPSLKISSIDSKHRNVLKRYERIKHMQEKGILKEGCSVFALPKIKSTRIKVKKEKTEEAAKAATAEAATSTAPAEAKSEDKAAQKKKAK